MQETGDAPRPSGLVTGAEAGAVIAVEVLVEQEIVSPVRILLKHAAATIDRAPAVLVAQKNVGQPAHNLLRHLIEGHMLTRARGTFDRERIAVVGIILQERSDNEAIHGHPDRSAP